MHLVLRQANDGGIRNISWLLKLCQLDRFIAVAIEKLIEEFGKAEQARLAQNMPKREITLCEDETFHPQVCLVAIEPVSNFLILEQYAEKPCSLQQLDLEKELICNASHLEEARNHASQEFELTQSRQRRARESRLGIGQEYHPYDPKTGAPVEAAQAQEKLNAHFDTLNQVASEAGLKASSFERLAKAKRVLPSMLETLLFFWKMIANRAANLAFSPEIVAVWKNQLVAAYYLASVAGRCRDSKERKRLRELSNSILVQAKARDGPLSALSETEVSYLEEQARSASEIFQRSSSCVEGRNGQFSLRHHGLRELSPRKLRVLGVLHNFVIQRSDGTTAANRFFGQPHRDLFGWLIENMPLPSRPRRKVQR